MHTERTDQAARYFVRRSPRSTKAIAEPVVHNASCSKLAQRNLPKDAYEAVEQPPAGSRPCRLCGG